MFNKNMLAFNFIILCSYQVINPASSDSCPKNRPHANTYWVEGNRFLAGEYPGHRNKDIARKRINKYLDTGINYFIDLTEQNEITRSGDLRPYEPLLKQEAQLRKIPVYYKRMPIKDMHVPTEKFMSKIIETINQALASGKNVYVHCWGGIGRMGTVVGSYLRSKGLTGTEALDQIKSWWKTVEKSKYYPRSPQTPEQFKFVKKFTPATSNCIKKAAAFDNGQAVA